MTEDKTKIEVEGYITREKMCEWAIATVNAMDEDGLDDVAIWDVEIEVWVGL